MPNIDTAKRALLLIPTTSYRAHDFMAAATKLGIGIVVGSNQNQVLEQFHNDSTVTIDFYDLERGVEQITRFAEQFPLNAIIPVDEETTLLAAAAAKALGLEHNSPESVEVSVDKHRFRSRLANSGVPSPWFSLVSLDDNPSQLAQTMSFPCVLKPLSLSGSRGVIRANNAAEFTNAFYRILKLLSQPDVVSKRKEVNHILVEGYIPGIEVALEGVLLNGRLEVLALFDKPDPLEGPYFEETIYVTPSRLNASQQNLIAKTAAQATQSMGLTDGPIHAELRLNDKGAWPIDVGARTIGGLCARTLRFGTGMSLEELVLSHALRLPIETWQREQTAAGVMMIPVPESGTFEDITGLDEANAIEGIEDISISIPIGYDVIAWPEGHKYLGFIFARGETPDVVENALRKAHASLDITITNKTSK
jgi:biotin carboxylase